MLTVAAILILLTGIAHSILGEKYILRRLFKRDGLPAIMGSDFYPKGTLRCTWHITSIAWWGIAWVL